MVILQDKSPLLLKKKFVTDVFLEIVERFSEQPLGNLLNGIIEGTNKTAVVCFILAEHKFLVKRPSTAQRIKFFIKGFSSKCDQICWKLRIWSYLLEEIPNGELYFLCSASRMAVVVAIAKFLISFVAISNNQWRCFAIFEPGI